MCEHEREPCQKRRLALFSPLTAACKRQIYVASDTVRSFQITVREQYPHHIRNDDCYDGKMMRVAHIGRARVPMLKTQQEMDGRRKKESIET